jgi:3-hydroxyisobutyrate dehydrogenase-like beta-hydroxyacid dehydrogenase
MSVTVAVIGAGKMGSIVAKHLPKESRKLVINRTLEKAQALASQINGEAGAELTAAKEADLVAILLPPAAVNETVEQLLDIVKPGAVILNMSTAAFIEPQIQAKAKEAWVVDAKIIGQSYTMEREEPAMIVVDPCPEAVFALAQSQLQGLGKVVKGEASQVTKLNTMAGMESLKFAVAFRKEMKKQGFADDWISTAIASICAGTLPAYTKNELGHFGRDLVKKLEAEQEM